MRVFLFFIVLFYSINSIAQSHISYDYISTSSLKDNDSKKVGEGSASIVSGKFDLPLYYKLDENKQPTLWLTTLSAKYADFYNEPISSTLIPDDIINTSLNLTHIRPLNKKWNLIASLGAGVYADHKHISWESVLANGGLFFVYSLNKDLKLGIGGGLTNFYGVPMILPMAYLKWQYNGKYELNVDFSGKLKIIGTSKISNKIKLELIAIEMEGISAVYETIEGTKTFSSTMYKSSIGPIYEIDNHFSAFINIGTNWRRTANVRDRELKNMFSFNNSGDHHFSTAMRIAAGIRYKIK